MDEEEALQQLLEQEEEEDDEATGYARVPLLLDGEHEVGAVEAADEQDEVLEAAWEAETKKNKTLQDLWQPRVKTAAAGTGGAAGARQESVLLSDEVRVLFLLRFSAFCLELVED